MKTLALKVIAGAMALSGAAGLMAPQANAASAAIDISLTHKLVKHKGKVVKKAAIKFCNNMNERIFVDLFDRYDWDAPVFHYNVAAHKCKTFKTNIKHLNYGAGNAGFSVLEMGNYNTKSGKFTYVY